MADTDTAPERRARGGFGGARTIIHLRGVPIRGDASLLLMAGFVTWIYFLRFSEGPLRDASTALVAVAAGVTALLFFASILAHELGHAFTSLDRDIPVIGITLFALGGVTESSREARTARDEFVIVGIGPFVSLVLAGAFGLLATLVADAPVLAAVFGYLGWTNLLLALFNIVPGYPLDGGRLLRSVLWGATGRPHAATRWAARVGQVFAVGLIVAGVAPFLGIDLGLRFGSLWEAFIGLFLLRGATDAHRGAQLQERLSTRTARQLMGSVPPTLDPSMPVGEALREVQTRPSLLWPVGSPVRGAVTLADLDRVPVDRWPSTTVGQVAVDASRATIDADTAMDVVLARLAGGPGTMLVVTEGGTAVGLLTPSLVEGSVSRAGSAVVAP